ncbi:unnamed protein product (macronuclear) [Paramecium tetraurelia]|uniref:Transmembrane protein n=1 Tax=Paramecium tetraurelia TaxID=5888 RepID=A0BVT4_PARTE|nr:uncharacterized protein GSPATT00032503001 [Paramecium tetraurelia]CAK62651.1 unnamed protein product [Paramecium tetraurelia]|eukprot:XP_001430049.1 hypothetical protein (macronuclear) [Paramecium tetraurelia strain d4-2]
MNSFTLTFNSTDLELKYQETRRGFMLPVFKGISIISLIICVIRAIISSVAQQFSFALVFLGLGIAIIISHFIINKLQKQWIDFYLFTINHILMMYQIAVNQSYDFQESFIFGQVMMTLHIIIILISDYKYAVIQIINNLIIKILIAELSNGDLSLITYLYTILIACMAIFVIQGINKKYRQSFLFVIQDYSKEKFIPLLFDNPFAIFTFDQNTLAFQVVQSNFNQFPQFNPLNNNQNNLKAFLRNYKLNDMKFEDFLFKRTKEYSIDNSMNNQELVLNHQKFANQNVIVKLSEVQVTELTFVIIMDQKSKLIKSQIEKIEQLCTWIQICSKSFSKFLKSQMALTYQAQLDQSKYGRIQIKYIQMINKLSHQTKKTLSSCSIQKKMKQIFQFYESSYNIKIKCDYRIEPDYTIVTNQQILNKLLFGLMQILVKLNQKDVNFKLQEELGFLDIFISLNQLTTFDLELKKNNQFRRALKILGPQDQPIFNQENVLVRIYTNMEILSDLQPFKPQ